MAKKPSSTLKDFRSFILRGNVVDLAVAVAVGAAFTAVVTALVASFITPLVKAIFPPPKGSTSGTAFSQLSFELHGSKFVYGDFINALLTFVITATVVFFLVVKPTQTLMRRFGMAPADPPAKAECPACLTEIPIAATRCSACTTELGADWAAPPPEATSNAA